MPEHDMIVVGASAGGVEALQQLVRQFSPDLPAAVFVVLHLPPRTRSMLPEILTRAGQLPAIHPQNGTPIEPGRIYVAPSDHHLMVERGHIHLSLGPKEQHHRPCINVMFRSAALTYGDRVTAVVLTGELDDGTAGLWEVKRRGGIAVVQNPEGAAFPSMPLSALREVEADYVVDIAGMGALLTRLARKKGEEKRTEVEGAKMEPQLTDLTCPDCKGTIWEVARGNGKEYRCRVGHTFSPKSMLSEHFAVQERAIYSAIVSLEEGASLAERIAWQFEAPVSERLREEARQRQMQAETLRQVLKERMSFSLD
ncbi:MAG: chemotaxis protein CheB [Acidobacteriaceae bacterium]|nr:chemotaxis protein CheB [Acidobacteriaceae bacterium]